MTEREMLIEALRLLQEERARLLEEMDKLPFKSHNYKEASEREERLASLLSRTRLGLDNLTWMEVT